MSFDVFLQRFEGGGSAAADASAIRALLEPLVVDRDAQWVNVATTDGEGDIYGYDNLDTGFMLNHASGKAIWDLVVAVASAAQLAIMPVGCPVCVTDPAFLDDLPPELAPDAVVITTGTELLHIIESP